MTQFTNISCYKFASLSGLKSLQGRCQSLCAELALKGTILLSHEGINLFVAGYADRIETLVAFLRGIPGLEDLAPKISLSDKQPFTRMLVKIKREIIAFGQPDVNPAQKTSRKIAPRALKQWLDEGRALTLLDTRNDYEIKLGTFANALPIGIQHFRDFPEAVKKLPTELRSKPVVMFCTGGIRCEKAGPFMELAGFTDVLQLDGGILKYFEECGASHYDGSCFVFDQRVSVKPDLAESEDKQCFHCLAPLSLEDQLSELYKPNQHCPYCYVTDAERMAQTIRERHAAIRDLTEPLPGSQPYDNYRPVTVPANFSGKTALDFIAGIIPSMSREHWTVQFQKGRFLWENNEIVAADTLVRQGDRFYHLIPETQEPDVNADIRILYEDEVLIVIDKPAPLPVHPSGRFNRNTLQYILRQVYAPKVPRPAHRLDANTSGLIVFSKSKKSAGQLQPQFEEGDVAKVYLALVQGHPQEDHFICEEPIAAEPSRAGARQIDSAGLAARTEFTVLERRANGTSLLEVRPMTGRTNQIRVHLWHLGLPICGDQTYLPDRQLGSIQTQAVDQPPLCLRAAKIQFMHPVTRKRMEFTAPPSPTF